MAAQANLIPNDKLSALWQAACADYAKQIGKPLADDDAPKLRGPEDLSRQLDAEKDNFEDFRMKRRPLLHAMQTVISPFETWGGLIAATSFPPASTIVSAMMLLIRGVRKVSEAFDMITDLFRKLGHFALRLDSYKGVQLSEGMKVIIVKVLANSLRVCTASQKLVSRGSLKARLAKWAKSTFLEDTEISGLLGELEELTSQEHMMVSAHGLNLSHQALRNTEELLERDNQRNDRERLQRVKAALNPVYGSSQVFSSINENRIPGSGAWVEEKLRSWWEGSEPILWLHGGPGVGKSFIASKIITELSKGELCAAPAPVVASFFCRNNDVDLRSFNKALRTLAWQVVTQREGFAAHAEEFCLKEDPENTYAVWRKLLMDYLIRVPSQATCFVIDGLDEADPEEQEILCSLLEKTFSEDDLSRPPLRIIMLSRDSLRAALEEHSLAWIEDIEVGNDQNKDDLNAYVAEKLQKTKLFRGSGDFQDEIITEIGRGAEGLWEWANLVIKSVLRCRTKEQIRKTVRTMPRGISAMLTQEMQRLGRELSSSDGMSDGDGSGLDGATQIDQLNIVLSFVTLAQKPLTVTQLESILEIIFKEEVLNLEDDLRTTYSSLFLLRPSTEEDQREDGEIVTLRHSSFYEFFRTTEETGAVRVNVDQTEVNFVYVIFYALRERFTPLTGRWLGKLKDYGQDFLSTHFVRASPEKAGKLRGDVSALVHDLFSKEAHRDWLAETFHSRRSLEYCFYPTASFKDVAEFWLDTTDCSLVNSRAEMTLQWLLPEAKQLFEENAQTSSVASAAGPFTVLFSYIAADWCRHWLGSPEIKADDGLPSVIPQLLIFYNNMVAYYTSEDTNSRERAPMDMDMKLYHSRVNEVFAAAEIHKCQKTPLWHVRVAQALLLNGHPQEALEQFQLALDEHKSAPTFGPLSLYVIHRDMARACSEIGRHGEALEHHELSESLSGDIELPPLVVNTNIDKLLDTARLQHHARKTADAVKTANEAWKLADISGAGGWPDFELFFNIFLELHQPQSLRPVFDRALDCYENTGKEQRGYKDFEKDFESFILRTFLISSRSIYRVLQYVLTSDDDEHLDRVTAAMKRLGSDYVWSRYDLPCQKYLLATVLFSKGRVGLGVDGWCQVVSFMEDDYSGDTGEWNVKIPAARSIGYLVSVCLEQPDIPPSEQCPLALDAVEQVNEACLVISMWLQKHGDVANAREALRGRMKHCIALLSDDDVSNDRHAFMTLFKTFVADPDSREDQGASLHLLKDTDELAMSSYNAVIRRRGANGVVPGELSQSLEDSRLTDEKAENQDDDDIDADGLNVWSLDKYLDECVNCRRELANIHFWYFCRSCPYTTLCRRCYRELKGRPHPSGLFGTCSPEHEFIYTGGLLRPTELVDDGMVPLVSADGDRRVIWVESWKDRLAEKWKTKDFEYEGGLTAWCMRVLPEPQRTRWAAFFQTD
jgi:tetratricopeptide (TPR) repeat protein